MDKIKYDSLYKFIVSIGIAIILVPFIFIVSTFNNNNVVMIKQNELSELTNIAQEIIRIEQNYKHVILTKSSLVLLGCCLIWLTGIVIVLYGIVQWNNKVQKNEDKSIELSNELLEKKIKNLTKEEQEQNVKQEIEENESIDNLEDKKSISVSNKRIQEYRKMKEKVTQNIEEIFYNYKILEEVKIDRQVYDCIALKKDEDSKDYIFEIKYFSSLRNLNILLEKMKRQLTENDITYEANTKRLAVSVLIVIMDKLDEKTKLENKKVLDSIEQYNWENQLTKKIIITDMTMLTREIKKLYVNLI